MSLRSQIGAGAVGPGVVQRAAAAALDAQGLQRTGERIKAGGEHDDVEFELLAAGTDSLFRDFLDRAVSVGIDQQHAVLVEGLVIVGVQRRSLGAEGVLLRHQLLGNRRILDHPADLVAQIVGDDFIGFPAQQHILIVAQPEDEAADVPHPLEFALSFLGGRLERRFRNAGQFEPRERVPRALDDRVVIGFAGGYSLRVDLAVARRQAVVRSPLENRQLFCLLSYLWDSLHRAGAGAYDRDALGGKIDTVARETAGVIPFAAKLLKALEWRQVGVGKGADRRDQKASRHRIAGIGADVPPAARLVELGASNPGIEANVALQVMAGGNVFQIAQDFRLLRIPLRPFPFLQQLFVPGKTIHVGLGIAPGPGIAVPVPGAADGFSGLVHPHLEPEPVAQRLQYVHAGEPGADDNSIEIRTRADHVLLPNALRYAADRSPPPRPIRSHRRPLILAENCRKGAENRGFIGRMQVRRIFAIGWWTRWRRAGRAARRRYCLGSAASTEGGSG